MKKYFVQGIVAATILVGAGFVACDEEEHTSAAGTTFAKMEMAFTYEVSDDLLEVADITFVYTNPAGEMMTVDTPMTTNKWEQTFSTTTLPSGFLVEVKVAAKPDVTLSKERYTLAYSWTDLFREYRSDEKVHWTDGPDTDGETMTLTANPDDPAALAAQIQSALDLMNRVYRYEVAADADGSGYEVTDND